MFGEPPNATYEEALSHFVIAEQLVDDWKENKLFLAKCKIAMGNYKEGVYWLVKAYNAKDKNFVSITLTSIFYIVSKISLQFVCFYFELGNCYPLNCLYHHFISIIFFASL